MGWFKSPSLQICIDFSHIGELETDCSCIQKIRKEDDKVSTEPLVMTREDHWNAQRKGAPLLSTVKLVQTSCAHIKDSLYSLVSVGCLAGLCPAHFSSLIVFR